MVLPGASLFLCHFLFNEDYFKGFISMLTLCGYLITTYYVHVAYQN